MVAGSGIGPAATVGLEAGAGAEVGGGDGFGTSVPMAADCGDVGPSSMKPRTSTIVLENSAGSLLGDRVRRPTPQRYVNGMAVLTDDQVDAALPDLPGWERADGALRRSIKFPAFLDGIDAVRRVAEKAEEKDHHPDIDIRWRTVTFALVTHSAGGITENDLGMAREINEIVGSP